MRKLLISGLFCSLAIINGAEAKEHITMSSDATMIESTNKANITESSDSKRTHKKRKGANHGKKYHISDEVKNELKAYKAKKKELYESLSPEAKKVLKRHHHKAPFSRNHEKKHHIRKQKDQYKKNRQDSKDLAKDAVKHHSDKMDAKLN